MHEYHFIGETVKSSKTCHKQKLVGKLPASISKCMEVISFPGIYKTISKPPYELLKTDDLSSSLPSLKDIQTVYTRFKQLFLIDNNTDFWATDVKWFSLLESTNWLEIIRQVLKKAIEVAECLERQHTNVLLIEESTTDLCCFLNVTCLFWQTGESLKTQSGPFRFLTVWDWSVQFDPKAQDFLNNPLYAEKPKPDKSQWKTARLKHQRQLSLPLTQTKSSPKRGFFREETDHLIKNVLGKRIGKFINSSDEPPNSFREFYDSWHSKPVDYHSLLLPRIDGPEIKVWAQRYLQWIPEAQLHGGGTIATAAKISDLMEEVQSLQVKMNEEHSQAISGDVHAVPMLRNSACLSSLFPFALLKRQSIKPALPTSTWKDLEDEDDLVKRDDEFVDLSGDMS
ncbi:myotubularin-related protein 12-like [Gymnogyps californianus]|uniref:myotubularin-related protein 12-like n=1 Tax=Gymnogyps californianus TaxID=33616 RepID=UPI0021C977A6|nr:myotubularin-related protein 12-like [Gymnogyps californianus]